LNYRIDMETLFDNYGTCMNELCVGDFVKDPNSNELAIISYINLNTSNAIIQYRSGYVQMYSVDVLIGETQWILRKNTVRL